MSVHHSPAPTEHCPPCTPCTGPSVQLAAELMNLTGAGTNVTNSTIFVPSDDVSAHPCTCAPLASA